MRKEEGHKKWKRYLLLLPLCLCLVLLFFAVRWAAAGKWTVTQYGSADDYRQSMFYSIKGSNGKVILIDGGWTEDADSVREVIRRLGGTVDLWIITHPHPDHAGAFNVIASDRKDIQIKKVIAPKIDASVYKKYAQSWDEYPVFTRFQELVGEMENVTYINEGDTLDFYGLHFEFFNSYYSTLPELTHDICNDSSLVFKVEGEKKSMLFTGDINSKVCKRLRKKYGEKLSADYMQAPHHGNNTGREKFFKLVNPEKAFIDAPSSLIDTGQILENRRLMEKLGIQEITYASSNRKVILA